METLNKTNLIIGSVDNYKWSQIEPWVSSIGKNIKKCKKIMLVYNIDEECLNNLAQRGFAIFKSTLTTQIVVQRFYDIWRILNVNFKNNNFEWILMTDVKDVVFQTCPFEWLNTKASNYDLISSSENITYQNEEWSNDNVARCFGNSILDLLSKQPIYNAGVIAGKADFISNLCLINYLLSLASKSNNPDQTTYNILLNTILKYCKVYKPTEKDFWAAQLGTTLDPHRSYNTKNLNIEPNPIFTKEGIVNTDGNKYSIVHQYDRVPYIYEFFNNQHNK